MRFKIWVKHKGSNQEPWSETYDSIEIKSLEDAEAWGRNTVESTFNGNLRPEESPREFVRAEIIGEGIKHNWEKQNAITITGKSGMYDKMKCSTCGVMGKRYGLGSTVVRYDEFKAKKYETCEWWDKS